MADITWQDRIDGTLGSVDRRFAVHENDKDRAYDMLGQLRAESIGIQQVKKAYADKLRAKNCLPKVIDEAVQRVGAFFGPWIKD